MVETKDTRRPLVRFADLVGGARFAAWMIGLLLALSTVGVLYPQDRIMTDESEAAFRQSYPLVAEVGGALGLGSLFTTWYFLLLVFLTALSIAVCTWRRVGARKPMTVPPADLRGSAVAQDDADTGARREDVESALASLWRLSAQCEIASDGDGETWRVAARGGALGFWGSVVAHAALVVVAIAGSYGALTSFDGRMLVTEGQTVRDEPAAYLRFSPPLYGPAFTDSTFTFDEIAFLYEGDFLTDVRAMVTVGDEPGSRDMRVNYPLEVAGKSYLLGNAGYAVDLLIESPSGTEQAFVNLGERGPSGYLDQVRLSDSVELALYATPNSDIELGEEVVRRYVIQAPVLNVAFVEDGEEVYRGALSIGESAGAAGHSVTFLEMGTWNELLVRADRGRGLLYLGLWLAVIGVAVRLADPDTKVLVRSGPGGVEILAKHRWGLAASATLARRARSAVAGKGK